MRLALFDTGATSSVSGQLSVIAITLVRDNGGQKLAYAYFEDEAGRRSAAKLLTKERGEDR
jgi:hypothetical protein